jgi:predicted RNA-binding protein with RPS1 domain
VDAKVIKIDADARKIGLSIRAFSEESDQSELDAVNRQASDTVTLGDMIPDEISDLRSALVDAEKQAASTDDDASAV